jgi:hypothetical protein
VRREPCITSYPGPDLLPPKRKRPPLRSEKIDRLPSSSGKDARLSSGRRGFESRWQCHIHLPVAQLDEQRATNAKACRFESCREGQSSVYEANLAPWRNRNAAVCKTAMSRGSTGRGFQHALVDQLDGQPSSKRPYAGSSPVERAI